MALGTEPEWNVGIGSLEIPEQPLFPSRSHQVLAKIRFWEWRSAGNCQTLPGAGCLYWSTDHGKIQGKFLCQAKSSVHVSPSCKINIGIAALHLGWPGKCSGGTDLPLICFSQQIFLHLRECWESYPDQTSCQKPTFPLPGQPFFPVEYFPVFPGPSEVQGFVLPLPLPNSSVSLPKSAPGPNCP